MTPKALVVAADPETLEAVADILRSLGHEHDEATCQEEARQLLARSQYTYYVLDLNIRVRAGRGVPRIQNGENLLIEIVGRRGTRTEPVIVISGHGTDDPDVAVRAMKLGADDYVTKPFESTGNTLDTAILEALAKRSCHSTGDAVAGGGNKPSSLQAFSGGEMVFYVDRIELCEVKIISDKGTGQSMMLLGELRRKDSSGRYVRRSAEELAQALDTPGGVGTITSCVATIRGNISERLRAQLGVLCGPDDVLAHDEQGYYLREWITVRDAAAKADAPATAHAFVPGCVPANVPDVPADVPASAPGRVPPCPRDVPVRVPGDVPADVPLNERQRWALGKLQRGVPLHRMALERRFGVHARTAKRDLADLAERGLIEFVRTPRPGYYRLKRSSEERRA